jgi:potassium/chloride transporter 4/5/6
MKNQAKNWGDGLTGLRQERAKRAMLGVHPKLMDHVKNWKPQLLIIDSLTDSGIPLHPGLISIADQLKKGNGLIIFAGIQVDSENSKNFRKAKENRNNLHDYFFNNRLEVISKVILTKKASKGIKNVLQTAGLGVLEPNCLLIPWPESFSSTESFEKILSYSRKVGLTTLCAKPLELFEDRKSSLIGTIDIWWIYYDGGIMGLITFLLTKHKTWKNCSPRIFLVVPAELAELGESCLKALKEWLSNNRVLVNVYTEVVYVPMVLLSGYTAYGIRIKEKGANYEPFFFPVDGAYEIPADPRELNSQIMGMSAHSELVVTVMPCKLKSQTSEDFLKYVDGVIYGIKRVIMVVPTTSSVVTDYN